MPILEAADTIPALNPFALFLFIIVSSIMISDSKMYMVALSSAKLFVKVHFCIFDSF